MLEAECPTCAATIGLKPPAIGSLWRATCSTCGTMIHARAEDVAAFRSRYGDTRARARISPIQDRTPVDVVAAGITLIGRNLSRCAVAVRTVGRESARFVTSIKARI